MRAEDIKYEVEHHLWLKPWQREMIDQALLEAYDRSQALLRENKQLHKELQLCKAIADDQILYWENYELDGGIMTPEEFSWQLAVAAINSAVLELDDQYVLLTGEER